MKENHPYFYARHRDGKTQTKGVNSSIVGHKIDRGPGARPEGTYAEWSWDGRKLTATNDRHGYFPLYYCSYQDQIYVSPSIRQILELGAPNEFDYEALSIFLRLSTFIEEDTPFKHIKVLPPDATFVWQEGRLTVSGKYPIIKPLNISEDDAIDQYIHLFRQAITRRLPVDKKFVVPLSGGRDSRHILLELNHLGYRPQCAMTLRPYPPFYDEDIRIAKLLCTSADIDHVALEQQSPVFINELRGLEITNYSSDEHAWMLAIGDHFQGLTSVMYDGVAGDVLSEHFWPQEMSDMYEAKNYKGLCTTQFNAWSTPNDYVFKWVLNKEFNKKLPLERAVERVTRELKKYVLDPSPMSSFYFWGRTRRKIAMAPTAVHARTATVYSPYVDCDLYDFLAGLPERVRRTLHTKTIQRAYPKYAQVPFEDNDAHKVCIEDFRQKYAKAFSWHLLKNHVWSSRVLSGRYLMTRGLGCLVSKQYASRFWWVNPRKMLYLLQLENLQRLALAPTGQEAKTG